VINCLGEPLEYGFGHVVHVSSVKYFDMEIDPRVVAKCAEEFLN
jgi:hypothetical protein